MAIYATAKRSESRCFGEGFDKLLFVENKCRLIEPGPFFGSFVFM